MKKLFLFTLFSLTAMNLLSMNNSQPAQQQEEKKTLLRHRLKGFKKFLRKIHVIKKKTKKEKIKNDSVKKKTTE